MDDLLETANDLGIVTITLNRPDRHNAFDDTLIAGLASALSRAGSDPRTRAVILASTGRSFCAGADLSWMRRMSTYSEDENLADAEALAGLMQTLDRLRCPTLAVIQGPAYGGGVGLAACCDIVVAAEGATFCLSEVRLGLTPATISPYVIRAIGARQARRYFATAETFSAARARDIGLVHEVVPAEGLHAERDRLVKALLLGAPGAQSEAKDLVFLSQDGAGDLAPETARRIARRRASPEGREGLGAFLERRTPSWRL